MNMLNKEKGRRICYMEYDLLAAFLRLNGSKTIMSTGLPNDVSIIAITACFTESQLLLLLESAEWEPAPKPYDNEVKIKMHLSCP
jgi:hypothetical protein